MAAGQIPVKKYQELIVWQKGMALVTEVYQATSTFPPNEIYGLTSQLRRAAVSVPSNIAEGQGRATKGEFVQFLCHARGSLYEVETQIILGNALGYLSSEQHLSLITRVNEIGRLLNGLLNALQNGGSRKPLLGTDH